MRSFIKLQITAETSSKDSGDEDTSNDQWLYTLYNFEGKDVVTKQVSILFFLLMLFCSEQRQKAIQLNYNISRRLFLVG